MIKELNLYTVAYLVRDSDLVVINKEQFKNASEDCFEEISLIVPESFIRDEYDKLVLLEDDEEEDEEDYY